MKKIIYTLLATASGLVLLFSYRTSTQVVAAVDADDAGGASTPQATSAAPSSTAAASSSAASSAPTSSSVASSSSAATSGAYKDGTYTGSAVSTRYGAVQVQVTVSGGAVTSVDALQYPDGDSRSAQINKSAIPKLASEAVSAQSASISMISGATYTSTGYISSLQSALDQAAK